MKVFVYTDYGSFPSRKCYLIPANTPMGACRKWNKANPSRIKAWVGEFIEYSDDTKDKYGFIDEHY